MTEAEALKFIATKQFGKTEEEITALLYEGEALKDNAGELLLQLSEDKIKRLKADRDDNFNKGYQKAQKEVMTAAEKKFKELTGFTGEGEDFEAIVKGFVEEAAKAPKKGQITDDDVKKHPLFAQLEQSRIPKDEFDKVKKEFDDFKLNVDRNGVLSTVKAKAWDIVSGKNPILPTAPQIANTLRAKFLDEFSQFEFEQQNGTFIVSKQGKRVEDEHGNLKPFESVVADVAGNFFEFQAQGDKGNAGNGGGSGGGVNLMPKTAAELNKVFAAHNSETKEDREARIAAAKYYEANKVD